VSAQPAPQPAAAPATEKVIAPDDPIRQTPPPPLPAHPAPAPPPLPAG
jgi:hypothetical protein